MSEKHPDFEIELMENSHPVSKAQNCIRAEALNYVVINNFLFRIDTGNDKDLDKGNLFLLVIPEKYEPIIFNTFTTLY